LKNITEEHIERFIRYPESLSDTEKDHIASAISEDAELRHLAEWFADFYGEFDSLTVSIPPKSVIPLHPIKKRDKKSQKKQLVFAAMSTSPQRNTMETVATLASESDRTVARILRNKGNGEYKIHLIRQQAPEENEKTIFTIEDLNMDLVLGSGRHLSFTAGEKLNGLNWQQASCSLRIPLGKCYLTEKELKSSTLEKTVQAGKQQISIHREDGVLKFTIPQSPGYDDMISRLIISDESESKLVHLSGETEFIIPVDKRGPLMIQFFN